MAGRQDDFLTGADLDELYSLLDGGVLDKSFDLEEELESVVPEKTSEGQFLCERCSKTYKTQRDLSRYFNSKHQQTEAEDNFGLSREEAEALKKLHPLQLPKIIKQSAEKCSNDQCLPELLDRTSAVIISCFHRTTLCSCGIISMLLFTSLMVMPEISFLVLMVYHVTICYLVNLMI